MSQPAAGPTTGDLVKEMLAITDTDDDNGIALVVAAVNQVVRALPISQADTEAWSPRIAHGATMLAARLWRRRNTPSGIEAFGVDGAVYVSRNDPDIAMLLELGAYQAPAVG